MNVAPYKVAIVVINIKDDKQKSVAEQLYCDLNSLGIETLLDDRNERPGVKFNDMDLIGIPIRITIGKKIADDLIEIKLRKENSVMEVKLKNAIEEIEKIYRSSL